MTTMTRRILARLTGVGLTLLVTTGMLVIPAGTAIAEEPTVPGKLLLMLDASGSMLEPDPSGMSKIDAAKQALTGVVDKLPDTAQVGLRVYGATVMGGKPTPEACADTQLVHPIGKLDKAGLKTAIAAFAAKGETPIAGSLTEALKDLGPTGKRNIVLVSDGEESCVPDPCPVIKELIGTGIDLQIDTVGFAVGDKARQQLQCIAEAGHGTYYDAKDASALATNLGKLSQRALRQFAVSGQPVTGTPTTAGAPVLTAGQYVDDIKKGVEKHYVVKRTMPGSTIRVSYTSRPPLRQNVGIALVLKHQGTQCSAIPIFRVGSKAFESVLMGGLRQVWKEPPLKGVRCENAMEYDLVVTGDHEDSEPYRGELLVMEEPPVATTDGLPAAEAAPDNADPLPFATPQSVVGGASVTDAPLLTPGTYRESFMTGEAVYYRVHVDWGQRLKVTVQPDEAKALDGLIVFYEAAMFTPDRRKVGVLNNAGQLALRQVLTRDTGEVRYLNRSKIDPYADLAGDYIVQITSEHFPRGQEVDVPITFAVAVEGATSGAPTYAKTAAPPASASASPSSSSASTSAKPTTTARSTNSVLPWIGGGLLGLAVLGGIGYAVWRRRAQGVTQA